MNRVRTAYIADGELPDFGAAFAEHMARKHSAAAYRASASAWRLLAALLRAQGIERLPDVAFMPNGKPYFPDCALYFSVSHSEGMAAAMIADAPCGVDIERVRENVRERLTARCLSPREIADGMDFFDVWTMKECIGKISGAGITAFPRDIDVCQFDYARKTRTVFDAAGNAYRLCAMTANGAERIEDL